MTVGAGNTTIPRVAANGSAGSGNVVSPTLASVSLSGFVPSTASTVTLSVTGSWKDGTPVAVLIAPNVNWGGTNNGPEGSNGSVWPLFLNTGAYGYVTLLLEALSFAWFSAGAQGAVAVVGWDDTV